MKFPLIAHHSCNTIFDLEPKKLATYGVRLLLADLDNTLVPYGVPEPDERLRQWTRELSAHGITLFILSNNRGPHRVRIFAEALGVPYIGHAGKPRPHSFHRAMEHTGCKPEETAIVGDQIFTDVCGGNRAGITTILVSPIKLAGNPGRYLRYGVEWIFRDYTRRKEQGAL